VVNISEGRDPSLVQAISEVAGAALLDVHSDPHHHRSVLTLLGERAARAVATAAVERLDLRGHDGVHPRLGVVDVVPFAALAGHDPADGVRARDDFAAWFAEQHGVPCFRYGPERTLPEVRRGAFTTLVPDAGPPAPHPTAGACAVGARPVLVAYNVWLRGADGASARHVATSVRGPAVRALGLRVGHRWQVSMNLIDPLRVGPAVAYDLVAAAAAAAGCQADGAELVGLVPAAALDSVPQERWDLLDLRDERTIEARVEASAWTVDEG